MSCCLDNRVLALRQDYSYCHITNIKQAARQDFVVTTCRANILFNKMITTLAAASLADSNQNGSLYEAVSQNGAQNSRQICLTFQNGVFDDHRPIYDRWAEGIHGDNHKGEDKCNRPCIGWHQARKCYSFEQTAAAIYSSGPQGLRAPGCKPRSAKKWYSLW